MRALYKHADGPGLALDTNRPIPTPGPRDVRIKVSHAGICGTDRHIYEWDDWSASRVPIGIVTGHEFVGTIESIGSAVTKYTPGQRVSAEGHICSWTDFNARTGNAHIARDTQILGVDRDGCFAEYVCVPEENVWPVHESIPDHLAAVMDPLGNAVHTVIAAGVSAKTVLITGAGIIGLMAVTVAKAAGAARIFVTDVDDRRLELAKQLGAAEAYNVASSPNVPPAGQAPPATVEPGLSQGTSLASPLPDWIHDIRSQTRGDGPDVLLEMSGNPRAIDHGFAALRMGGTAALLGIPPKPFPFDLTDHIIFKGAQVLGINGRRMFETWYQMEALLLSGRLRLEPIITHTLPLEQFDEAFRLMQTGDGIKIVLEL